MQKLIAVDVEIHRKLSVIAALSGLGLKELVDQALGPWVEKELKRMGVLEAASRARKTEEVPERESRPVVDVSASLAGFSGPDVDWTEVQKAPLAGANLQGSPEEEDLSGLKPVVEINYDEE